MLDRQDVRTIVLSTLTELLAESGSTQQPEESHALADTGLGSLLLARLLILLELETGVDPFAEDLLISDVRTVGDLVDAYHAAMTVSIAI